MEKAFLSFFFFYFNFKSRSRSWTLALWTTGRLRSLTLFCILEGIMSADPKAPASEVSKTQMLRSVLKDVSTLRTDLTAQQQTIEQISTWAKTTVKPGMQQLQGM